MTLHDLKRKNKSFMDCFGDFWLRHTFQERIAPKSLEVDRDSLRMKLSALNVVLTSLIFAPLCVQGFFRTETSNLGTPFKILAFGHLSGGAIWRM